jgi:hypothetical protein
MNETSQTTHESSKGHSPITCNIGSNKIANAEIAMLTPLFFASTLLHWESKPQLVFVLSIYAFALIGFVFLYYKSKFRKHGEILLSNGIATLVSKRYGWESKKMHLSDVQSLSAAWGSPYKISITTNRDSFVIELQDASLSVFLSEINRTHPHLMVQYLSGIGKRL